MSKRRSGLFARIEKDFYRTPFKAVPPLIPQLNGINSFAEPCYGKGDLARHLESFGLRCSYAGDITTGQDAEHLTAADCAGADVILTNPPFSEENQPLLCRLITHLSSLRPTWLLLPHDFAANLWFAPYLRQCTDIIAIGRLKWIEDTANTGMENFDWYRFEAGHTAYPIFQRAAERQTARALLRTRTRAGLCAACGRPYRPRRSDARFCTDTCRQRAHRRRISRDKP
jgi:hypothetical protein